jgi:hypothetical protein
MDFLQGSQRYCAQGGYKNGDIKIVKKAIKGKQGKHEKKQKETRKSGPCEKG